MRTPARAGVGSGSIEAAACDTGRAARREARGRQPPRALPVGVDVGLLGLAPPLLVEPVVPDEPDAPEPAPAPDVPPVVPVVPVVVPVPASDEPEPVPLAPLAPLPIEDEPPLMEPVDDGDEPAAEPDDVSPLDDVVGEAPEGVADELPVALVVEGFDIELSVFGVSVLLQAPRAARVAAMATHLMERAMFGSS